MCFLGTPTEISVGVSPAIPTKISEGAPLGNLNHVFFYPKKKWEFKGSGPKP